MGLNLLEKVFAGSGLLIALYLVTTNPNGTSQATNSIFSGGVNFVKALQGR